MLGFKNKLTSCPGRNDPKRIRIYMNTCLNKPAVVFKTNCGCTFPFLVFSSTVYMDLLWDLHADGKNVVFVKARFAQKYTKLLLCGFSFLVVCLFYFCFYFQKAPRSEFPEAKDSFLSIFQSQDDIFVILC